MATPASVAPVPERKPGDLQLIGFSEPVKGTGALYYYPTNALFPMAKIGFQADPWAHTGVQPFSWKLIIPTYVSERPTILIVANRDVWITGATEIPLTELGDDEPFLEVIRMQNRSSLPDPASPYFLFQQLVRPPYLWVEGMLPEELEPKTIFSGLNGSQIILENPPPPRAYTANIVTRPYGVDFINNEGGWKFSLTVPDDRPAAFAYEIYLPKWVLDDRDRSRRLVYGTHSGFYLRIIRTRGIEPDTWFTVNPEDPQNPELFVEDFIVDDVKAVPQQGMSLLSTGFAFTPYRFEPKHQRFSKRLVNEFNSIIGMFPIVGSIYDIAQWIYAWKNGKDFYKWEVSQDDLAWFGVAGVLGFLDVIPVGGAIADRLIKILKGVPVKSISKVVAPEVAQALHAMTPADGDAVLKALERYAKRQATLIDLMKEVGDVFDARMTKQFNEGALRRVFSPDYSGFAHSELDELYRAYVAAKGPEALDPLQWVKQTRGRSRQLLEMLLGKEFPKQINEALIKKRIVVLTGDDVSFFLKVTEKDLGVGEYDYLKKLKEGHSGFEADHLVEKRFCDLTGVAQHQWEAIIIPADRHIAKQLQEAGVGFKWVHSDKTRMLAELIPHGAEDRFTLQQVWEAHTYVLESLGVEDEFIDSVLREEFDRLSDALGQVYDPRVRKVTRDRFLRQDWSRHF